MSQDRRTTRPRMTPWDRDGTHGRPSSFDILLEWLASNGNEGYLRWISSEGKRPELCGEIIAMLYLHGIHHRTHKCIHLKMFMLINSYKDACNHLRDHGQEEPPIGQEDFSPTPPVEDASYNLFERPNVNILADMQETLQAAGISLQPCQVAVERFNVTYEVLDLPPSPTPSVEMDPDDLCCFCDEILPKNPSAAFLKANKSLRALPEVRARNESKNPLVLYLPFGQRAEHCQLHEAELSTIPDGINRGWPTQIDFDQLFR
ncbi:hypothetical protein PSHT_02814 [Puccinia striiformis]|uniref:Uncharacterized protein n=1 Tax=Puccinia striiformis TaxID=27350 RepID=A0A2S4WH11_9BASI|nr:hypothetical protein PSHT_02814 [Puccinia striiformis]